MKKLLLVLAVAVSSVAANAQVFVGGALGLNNVKVGGAETTHVTIAPEVGFALNNQWTLATTLSYTLQSPKNGLDVSVFEFNPYARYTAAKWGAVSLIFDGGVGLNWSKVKGADADFGWSIGIKPGLAVNLSKNVTFVTHLGELGYSDRANVEAFGYDFNTTNVNFGVYYNF